MTLHIPWDTDEQLIEQARRVDQALSEAGYPNAYVTIKSRRVVIVNYHSSRFHYVYPPKEVINKAFELTGLKVKHISGHISKSED
jgi:hypothetical protein